MPSPTQLTRGARCAPLLVVFIFLAGCANRYRDLTYEAHGAFHQGDFRRAAKIFHKGAGKNSRNRLLYLLDEGMSYHCDERYNKSSRVLLEADRLMEKLDYTSLSTETATFLSTDRIRAYSGVDYEFTLVNIFLAVNFVMEDNLEDARVEAKRISMKLERIEKESGEHYKENLFGRYLRAIIHEALAEWNDAYVEYKIILDHGGAAIPYLYRDLYRMAVKLGLEQDAGKWKRKLHAPIPAAHDDEGELIFLYECGLSPAKVETMEILPVPQFRSRPYGLKRGRLVVDQHLYEPTHILHDIEAVATRHLKERIGRHLAKAAVQLAAKETGAEILENKVKKYSESEPLGDVTGLLLRMGLYSSQQADLRSWRTLPANLQLARLRVPAGPHHVRAQFLNAQGNMREEVEWGVIQVDPGDIIFLNHRTIR